ncbi:MAG: flagellar assembly protein A [Candidatus Latescibacterota bacterium]
MCGRELPPPPVATALPAPGEGVAPPTDGGECLAEVCGYLQVRPGTVSLVPPVWVAPDEMTAYGLQLSPPNRPLSVEVLEEALCQAGVAPLPERDWLAARLRRAGVGPGALRLASGRSAEPGHDGQAQIRVPLDAQVGKVLADGSIDYRSRGFGVCVEPGALLAVVVPPTAGRDGATVRGRPLPASAGQAVLLQAGEGVEAVVDVCIGAAHWRVTETLRRVVFRLSPDGRVEGAPVA